MRKEHKKKEKMGKETIGYWKSANDIIAVNYSVHSNNQLIDIVALTGKTQQNNQKYATAVLLRT